MNNLLKKGLFVVAIIVAVIIFLIFIKDDNVEEGPSEFNRVTEASENDEELLEQPDATHATVDIKGEVMQPGVYEISLDSRVNDAIELAGGFTEDADPLLVNLAQRIQDEMVIAIPKVGEDVPAQQPPGNDSAKVKVNYATEEEMETLNGIGPAKAQAIIQYRDENGFFQTVEDLLEISGIGEKTLENFRDDIQIP